MPTIDLGSENAADGLVALVVAVLELLVETMEREGVRRMESGQLTDEEVERLGAQFMEIEAEIDRIKEDAGVEQEVESFRAQLDGLVDQAIDRVDAAPPTDPNAPTSHDTQ